MRHILDSREAYEKVPEKVARDAEPDESAGAVAISDDPMWQMFSGNDDLDLLLKVLREEARRAHLMRVQGWC